MCEIHYAPMGKETTEKELLELWTARRRDVQNMHRGRRKKMGPAGPTPIATVLTSFFSKDATVQRRIDEQRALAQWEAFVGPAAGRVSKALRMRNGVLTVGVSEALWMQQLSFLKHSVLERYRKEFPKAGIKDIYFVRQG